MRVAVIFGGANSEHEVSCASARDVVAALGSFDVTLLGIDRSGRWHTVDSIDDLSIAVGGSRLPDLDGFDVAIPVLHGLFGEDGTVQGLLELASVPYVGCGVLASALAMSKLHAGRVLGAAGIPVIETVAISRSDDAGTSVAPLGLPLFVKPNRSGSSVGVTRVDSLDALAAALELAFEHDDTVLVQPAMNGDEVDVGILQHPDGSLSFGAPLRVRPGESASFFDFAAKYTAGGASFEVPALLDPAVSARLMDLAGRAFAALGCDGLARVDFFVSPEGDITVNEVNTMPGMSALSQFPRMFAAAGMSLPGVLEVLVSRALVRAGAA